MDSHGNMAVYLVFSLFSLEQRKEQKTIKLWIARIIIIAINIWCYCSFTAICNKILIKITRGGKNSSFYKIFFFSLSVILEIKPSILCMPGKHIPLCYMPSPFFLELHKMSARGKFQWQQGGHVILLQYQFTLLGQMMSCLWGWIFVWR